MNYVSSHGHKIAVIVNEFGEVGIDNKLVVGADEEIFEMNNGCICCTVRGDLIRIPGDLLDARVNEDMDNSYYLDSVITMVDARHADQHLDEGHEAQEQVAFADVLLLNKVDLVESHELQNLEKRLRAMNPHAKIYQTHKSNIELEKILGINAFDIQQKLEVDPGFLQEEDHEHDDSVFSIVLREERPLDLNKVEKWVSAWILKFGTEVFRYNGILYIKDVKQRVIFQGVHMLFESTGHREWREDEARVSEVVLIGRNLDREWFQEGFAKCVAR